MLTRSYLHTRPLIYVYLIPSNILSKQYLFYFSLLPKLFYIMLLFDVTYIILFPSGALMYLNEATLLHNIRVRYGKDKIYVSAGQLRVEVWKGVFTRYWIESLYGCTRDFLTIDCWLKCNHMVALNWTDRFWSVIQT